MEVYVTTQTQGDTSVSVRQDSLEWTAKQQLTIVRPHHVNTMEHATMMPTIIAAPVLLAGLDPLVKLAEIVKVNHAKMVEVVLSVVQDMSVCVHQDGEATSVSKILMSVHHLLVPMPENALISLMTLPVNVNLDGMEDFVMKVSMTVLGSAEMEELVSI